MTTRSKKASSRPTAPNQDASAAAATGQAQRALVLSPSRHSTPAS
jgi:hypothetical protein